MVWLARVFLYATPSLALLLPRAQFLPLKIAKVVCVVLWLTYAHWLERANGVGFSFKHRRDELIPVSLGILAVDITFWLSERLAKPESIVVLLSKIGFSGAFFLAAAVLAPNKSMSKIRLKFWRGKAREVA